MRHPRALLPFFIALSFGFRAIALVVEPGVIEKALQSATLVGSVRVEEVETSADEAFHTRWRARAWVLGIETWRGVREAPRAGDEITITGIGGERDDTGVLFLGYPKPFRNRVYSAHLVLKGDGTYTVAGFDAGLVPVFGPRQFSRNRTDGSNGDGSGPFLYWDERYFPISYFISASSFQGFPQFADAVDRSFRTWAQLSGTRVDFLALGCSSTSSNENDGMNNVILIRRDWPFDDTVIAITRNFFIAGSSPSAGLILDSDIMLNAVDHEFSVGGQPGKHDVQNIVTHEVGHLLGLGHEINPSPDSDATMFAVANVNELKKRDLAPNDIAGITQGYAGSAEKVGTYGSASCLIAAQAGCASVGVPGAGNPVAVLPLLVPLLLPWWTRRRRSISAP